MLYRLWRTTWIGCLLIMAGVIGALAQGDPTPAQTEPTSLLNPALLADDSLLTGELCAAPCWRGITPGETTWDDALTILQADPTLENVQVQTDANSDSMFASWGQTGGESCCQLFSLDGEIVTILFLRFAPDITLGELFAVQGEPAYAVGSMFTQDEALVNLIYPETRMVIYAFVTGESGSLSADSPVIGALFMSPADLDLLLGTANLHEWRGYADYAAYSPDTGFDATLTPIGG